MSYAIVGAGNVGKALAKAFARKKIEVALASRRSPDELAPVAKEVGSTVKPKSLEDALKADVVLLAVPFKVYKDVAKASKNWKGKTVIDVTNAYGVTPQELGNRPSSAVIADALSGADVVKAFNSLEAETLAEDPAIEGGRRVVFLAGDDEKAVAKVVSLAEDLGFAPVPLGKLDEGGSLIRASDKERGPLVFQKLVKFDKDNQ